jgi:hypothetical protein
MSRRNSYSAADGQDGSGSREAAAGAVAAADALQEEAAGIRVSLASCCRSAR